MELNFVYAILKPFKLLLIHLRYVFSMVVLQFKFNCYKTFSIALVKKRNKCNFQ